MSSGNSCANSHAIHFSDWAAMGLPERSGFTAFDMAPPRTTPDSYKPPRKHVRIQDQEVQEANKADLLQKMLRPSVNILKLNSMPDAPAYLARFKTLQAYENHKANARLQAKKAYAANAERDALKSIPSRDVLAHDTKPSIKAATGRFATS